MVWKVKDAKGGKKQQKKVSFATPIATELKLPKRTQPDDSIMLIKAMEGGSESQIDTSMMLMEDSSMGTEKMQQALAATLRMMERTLATAGENLHFQRPIEKNKMEAIQVLIEEGNKMMKMGSITGKMTARVGLDA